MLFLACDVLKQKLEHIRERFRQHASRPRSNTKANYAAALDPYVKGLAAQGYAQSVLSVTPAAETHEYTKGRERMVLTIAQQPKGIIRAHIEIPTMNDSRIGSEHE